MLVLVVVVSSSIALRRPAVDPRARRSPGLQARREDVEIRRQDEHLSESSGQRCASIAPLASRRRKITSAPRLSAASIGARAVPSGCRHERVLGELAALHIAWNCRW